MMLTKRLNQIVTSLSHTLRVRKPETADKVLSAGPAFVHSEEVRF